GNCRQALFPFEDPAALQEEVGGGLPVCPKDVPRRTKLSVHIVVFGVVSNEGSVMPPHIFN
ncbi:Hypothetical protein FKW44_024945, partial [Caligus rogercresseyi]